MKPRNIRCMKVSLTIFNVICLISAIILMAVCIMDIHTQKVEPDVPSLMSKGTAGFLIFVGLMLLLVGTLGCVGALKAHSKILYWYAGFFIFLVSVELIVGVAAALYSVWLGNHDTLREQFFNNLKPDSKEMDSKHLAYWDKLQSLNECCGVDGPTDYSEDSKEVPASCCPRIGRIQGRERARLHSVCLNEHKYFKIGCEDKINKVKSRRRKLFVASSFLFTLFEITCIVLAFWMAKTLRTERRRLQQNLQSHYET